MIKDIKYNGYTATPSDYECPDGDLAAAHNLVPEDGALHPILPPQEKFTIPDPWVLKFLHQVPPYGNPPVHEHYIVYNPGTYQLGWLHDGEITPIGFNPSNRELYKIDAVGNTVLALTSEGIFYYLWKDGRYVMLGNKIPDVTLSFGLTNPRGAATSEALFLANNWEKYYRDREDFSSEDKTAWNNMLMGAINKLIAEEVTGKGLFCMPFFVRYALRMYDGTLTMHSAPVLMLPSGLGAYLQTQGTAANKVFAQVIPAQLDYIATAYASNLDKWSDIVTSVDIFVSAPIWTYNQAGEVSSLYGSRPAMMSIAAPSPQAYHNIFNAGMVIGSGTNSIAVPHHDAGAILENIKDCGNFYLLKSIKLNDLNITTDADFYDGEPQRAVINPGNEYLQSLTSREVMTDDYQSHDIFIPKCSFNYNSRLNIANIKRRLFSGYNPLASFCYHNSDMGSAPVGVQPVSVMVEIDRDGSNIVVERNAMVERNAANLTLCFLQQGCVYFFYPDTQAKNAILRLGNNYYDMPLTPHAMLNGAFFFSLNGPTLRDTSTKPLPAVSPDPSVLIPNKLYQSEVNNPFSFPLTSIDTVGKGTILAMCAATKALSQGQFGQFPLYCFTTEGIWALETASTGIYLLAKPLFPDVINKDADGNYNVDSITQLDDAVLFTSDRGIMLLSGSTCQCISDDINSDSPASLSDLPGLQQLLTTEQLSVPALLPFSEFLNGCRMIYDYTHQRIIVYNTSKDYAYVYSLKDHKWSTMPTSIDYGINSYPEALAVTDDGMLIDLSKDGNVTTGVKGIIITRPIKLEPDILKTWDTVIQRGYFNHLDTSRSVKPIRTILYGSRDLFHWFLISSSTDHNLRGFRGTPYKYFRIVLLVDLRPDESIYGCTIQYNPRYLNRPR